MRYDRLLTRIEDSQLGFHIGHVNVGAPICADDMPQLSHSTLNLQAMVNIAMCDSELQRYQYSTKKTKSFIFGTKQTPLAQASVVQWKMNDNVMQHSTEEVHLGLVRTSDGKLQLSITML